MNYKDENIRDAGEKPTPPFVDVRKALRGEDDEAPLHETNKRAMTARPMGEEALRRYQGYMEQGFPRDEAVDRALENKKD